MYDIKGDGDLSHELVIDQLCQETKSCDAKIWEKTRYSTYNQYLFTSKVTDTINMCFRIYHYKTHDYHQLNIYMHRKVGNKYISIFMADCPEVIQLVKIIEDTKKYYYAEE